MDPRLLQRKAPGASRPEGNPHRMSSSRRGVPAGSQPATEQACFPLLASLGQNWGDSCGGRNVPLHGHNVCTGDPQTPHLCRHAARHRHAHIHALTLLSQGLLYTHLLFCGGCIRARLAATLPGPRPGSLFSQGLARLSDAPASHPRPRWEQGEGRRLPHLLPLSLKRPPELCLRPCCSALPIGPFLTLE